MRLEAKKKKRMNETFNERYIYFHAVSSTGQRIYSEVKAFLQKEPNIIVQCKSISTVNETLTLTENHLVYARKSFSDHFHPM